MFTIGSPSLQDIDYSMYYGADIVRRLVAYIELYVIVMTQDSQGRVGC